MIYIVIAFIVGCALGFCLGGLYELRNTREAIKLARKINDDWKATAEQLEKEWSGYCKELIKENEELRNEINN